MRTNTTNTVTAGTALALLALGQSSLAALSVQDSFTTGGGPANYDDTTALVGQGPTGTTGYTGVWQGDGDWDVSTTSLTSSVSGYVGSSGGSVISAGDNGRTGRELSSGFDGTSTGTIYLSFLMDLSHVAGNTGFRAFETHTGTPLGDGTRNWALGLHNDGFFGTLSGSAQKDTIGLNVGGASVQLGDASVDTGANLFLLRFDLSSTADSDNVTVWMNPTLTASGDPAGGQTLTGRNVAFSFLSMGEFGDGTIAIDEIRMGTNLAEVAGIPEPSTVLLLTAGLGGLFLRRRK